MSTKYGQRPVSEIYDDIRRWVDYYRSTSGIFFDEQSKDDNDVALYRELFAYARNAIGNALVVGNPGVIPSERYTSEAGADLECLFESEESFDLFVPPDWTIEYPDRFCALLLNVSHADSMKKHLRKAFHEGIGTVYATNRKTNGNSQNPWDSLPKYWDDEVDTLIQLT